MIPTRYWGIIAPPDLHNPRRNQVKILLTILIVLSIIVPTSEAFARKPGYTGYGPSGHGPTWCAGSTIPYCTRR